MGKDVNCWWHSGLGCPVEAFDQAVCSKVEDLHKAPVVLLCNSQIGDFCWNIFCTLMEDCWCLKSALIRYKKNANYRSENSQSLNFQWKYRAFKVRCSTVLSREWQVMIIRYTTDIRKPGVWPCSGSIRDLQYHADGICA
jgi:hypothetical protein